MPTMTMRLDETDAEIVRTMGCGIAGLSIVADSLAAIKYAKVTPVRDETGLVVDYVTEGDFPIYGNDDDRADGDFADASGLFCLRQGGAHEGFHFRRRGEDGDRRMVFKGLFQSGFLRLR